MTMRYMDEAGVWRELPPEKVGPAPVWPKYSSDAAEYVRRSMVGSVWRLYGWSDYLADFTFDMWLDCWMDSEPVFGMRLVTQGPVRQLPDTANFPRAFYTLCEDWPRQTMDFGGTTASASITPMSRASRHAWWMDPFDPNELYGNTSGGLESFPVGVPVGPAQVSVSGLSWTLDKRINRDPRLLAGGTFWGIAGGLPKEIETLGVGGLRGSLGAFGTEDELTYYRRPGYSDDRLMLRYSRGDAASDAYTKKVSG